MAKKRAIFFPTEAANVPAHVTNINTKVVATLGTKYDWTVEELAELLDHNTKIPTDINAATVAMQTAQGLNETKDNRIYKCELFLNKKGRDMQDHANFDSSDLESLGMFVIHTPPNPDTAQPSAKITVLPDMVRIDWTKGPWGGILVWTSYNGTTWSATPEKDLRSPWEDTRPNQQPGVAETRHYKLRHIDKNDTPIGLEIIIKAVVNIG